MHTKTRAPVAVYQFFSRIFRYSTFIGGPTCTCTPIKGTRQIAAKIYAKGRQGGCLKEVMVRSYSKSPME